MQTYSIPLVDAPFFKPLFTDYVSQKPTLKPFYDLTHEKTNYEKQILKREKFPQKNRTLLYEALSQQYKSFQDSKAEKVQQNIEKIKEKNTFTITTGHQLNLCTGPIFLIYKVLKTIKLTQELIQNYPNHNFIPVFWMLTEDHDLEEINHFNLFGKRYSWNQANTKALAGTYNTTGINDLLENIDGLPNFFKIAYTKKNLAEATRYYLHELFGNFGLVILDSNTKKLKELFRPVITKELLEQTSEKLVLKSIHALKDLGYKSSVNPRPINLFYNHEKKRKRILEVKKGSQNDLGKDILILEDNTTIILEKAFNTIENFSPNVILRPVYQELILPNLAYIGGPAEINYWLEYKALFNFLKIPYPILVPRTFAFILSKTLTVKFETLNLKPEDLFLAKQAFINQVIAANEKSPIDLAWVYSELNLIYNKIEAQIETVNPQLLGYFNKQRSQVTQTFKQIQKRLKKSLEEKHSGQVKKAATLFDKLYPENVPQERFENFLTFYINYPDFISDLYQRIEPFKNVYYIFNLKG